MKYALVILMLLVPLAYAGAKVKIATVPEEFTPNAGPGLPEPVSMSSYYFEVNLETSRARVVIDYTYRNQAVFEGDDAHGPSPTYAQLPGLTYDASAHAVVYRQDGESTVCATVQQSRGLFGPRLKVTSTGKCFVTAETTKHAEDNGWSIRRFSAIDTYFETH
jgi:hypothetical protein